MKIFIGIDPGKSGALAAIFENGAIEIIPFNSSGYIDHLAQYAEITQLSEIRCCVEKVSAMPGQGVTSMFNFGHNLGFIEGCLQSFRIPYQLVPPQTWKKEFSLSSDKNKSIEVCQKLFPDIKLLPTDRCKKPNDGMAEALLMAEYARRKF